jgi:hypothetical protein
VDERALHRWLCLGVIATAVATAIVLRWVTAPYGRHARPGWGPTVSARTAWIGMELPSAAVFLAVYLWGHARSELVPVLLCVMWQAHYLHRSLVFPFQLGPHAKAMPVSVAAMGALFNTVNGYINARQVSELGSYPVAWLGDPRFLLGVVLFAGGYLLNRRADATLRHLKRDNPGSYSIPRGGAFRFVSCPNYLGEIIEWCGWALATWSLAGATFAIFTVANLLPRALAHHRWYRERFADYPSERRAIVPLLW